ncbi:SGNH/GDSL hydrolase family protein [Ferruginibacter albus]|uniref:SGNH/GDSL hydrolase family protein n=1 Tax=Ferruginibacter albus TaxID=2875540 RepID=UPI001CC75717|nr:SGNH/GDSL hydrolase family protein [Ferruginibacter albus]
MSVYSQSNQSEDWPNLRKYADSNKLLPAKTIGEKRIVFMGNSITEFWKQIDSSFFANKSFVNRGISGQTSSQMLLRFRQDVIDIKPDVVVILAGINDIAENTGPISLEDILGNIISMCELAKTNKIKVVLSSVLPANKFLWRMNIKPAEKVIRLNDMIRSYAAKNNIVFLDYYSAMVDDQKGLGKEFSEDGVHPNLKGYKIMEPLVVKAISKALKHKN